MIAVIVHGIFASRGKFDTLSSRKKLLKEMVMERSLSSMVSDISKLELHLNIQSVSHSNAK